MQNSAQEAVIYASVVLDFKTNQCVHASFKIS